MKFMGLRRRISALIFKRKAEQLSSTFIKNGSMLLEEFMDSCNGRYNIPIRNFSAKQILRATNNFDQHHLILDDGHFKIYKGSLEERLILAKKFDDHYSSDYRSKAIRDIVITSQMRSHKNVARLFGYCLEFEGPALVYEYSGNVPLQKLLINKDKASGHEDSSLGWKSRLRIANEIANAVAYLHTALSRHVVNRDLNLNNIMIDQHGVTRLFDFSLSISISPEEEESGVADPVVGTLGYVDPEYFQSGFVTEKSDAYNFGVILLQLLTRKKAFLPKGEQDERHLAHERAEQADAYNFKSVLEFETAQTILRAEQKSFDFVSDLHSQNSKEWTAIEEQKITILSIL
ncbi:hypothetical protein F0562_020825 [Nyssa sinensis]|uniref:Protein kinase domain-containing protein n=1 Tax=Nyssa sinensis TaxID=561372 RepID=A0A5J5BSS9_9ASTE|nr:hypothetical protein F0562_020825 [Nyssa sinensis]